MTEKYINPHTDFGFKRLFGSEFNKQELKSYEDSVNAYRDIVNAIRTAEKKKFAEGRAEGRAEGAQKEKIETAKRLLAIGADTNTIAIATGLTTNEVESLIGN